MANIVLQGRLIHDHDLEQVRNLMTPTEADAAWPLNRRTFTGQLKEMATPSLLIRLDEHGRDILTGL